MTLVEKAVKTAAENALYNDIDTIVGDNDLIMRESRLWKINHTYYLTCPEFNDFYVRVRTDRFGVPKHTVVYIEK